LKALLIKTQYHSNAQFSFMVFNATFNNISVISWRSVLLVEETGGPGIKAPTCRKSLTNFITKCCTHRPARDRTHNVSGDRH